MDKRFFKNAPVETAFKFKKIFAFSLFFLIFSNAFSQTEDGFTEIENPQTKPKDESATEENKEKDFVLPSRSFFITAGPLLLLNTDKSTSSAPSPVSYSLGFGADFRQDKKLNVGVRASFFTGYWLFDGNDARPAEIENRTATALCFLFDGAAGRTFLFSHGKNALTLSGGLGFLARIGILSNDVGGSESGASGSASSDVSEINSWFWSSARFLYPEFCVSFLHAVPELLGTFRFGADFRIYAPFGSLISGNGVDGMIFSLALKASF